MQENIPIPAVVVDDTQAHYIERFKSVLDIAFDEITWQMQNSPDEKSRRAACNDVFQIVGLKKPEDAPRPPQPIIIKDSDVVLIMQAAKEALG